MLFDRERIVSATFNGGIVGDNHTLFALDDSKAGHNSSCWRFIVIASEGGKGRKLHKLGARIHQALNALASRKLAARFVLFDGGRAAACLDLFQAITKSLE